MSDQRDEARHEDGQQPGPEPDRVAVISLHTSPLDQPGTGDSGGMNIYILSVAERLAEQGIAVDIFTRCHGQGGPAVEEISPRSRLIGCPVTFPQMSQRAMSTPEMACVMAPPRPCQKVFWCSVSETAAGSRAEAPMRNGLNTPIAPSTSRLEV